MPTITFEKLEKIIKNEIKYAVSFNSKNITFHHGIARPHMLYPLRQNN